MKRGTTPTHTFTLPFEVDLVKKVRVLYSQDDNLKVTKTEDDVVMKGNTIQVKLTQEDTFKLLCSRFVEIQVRVLTTTGEAMSSDIIRVALDRCLEEAILG